MGFYKSISVQYNSIFPLNRMQIGFKEGAVKDPGGLSLLDVGCDADELSTELSGKFVEVSGIGSDGAKQV